MQLGAQRRACGRHERQRLVGRSIGAAHGVRAGAQRERGGDFDFDRGLAAQELRVRMLVAVRPQRVSGCDVHERVRGCDVDESSDRVAVARELDADARALPAHSGVEVRPRLRLEAGVSDLVARLAQVRSVGEQLEQCRRSPGAAEVRRQGHRRRGPVHDAQGAREGRVIARLVRHAERRIRVGREPSPVDPPARQHAHAPQPGFFEGEHGGRADARVGNERDPPACVVGLVEARRPEYAADARAQRVMGQHVDGERVEQQVERGPFERGAARARSGVRHFDERVALPLRLRFEPHPPQQVVARELHPVVG